MEECTRRAANNTSGLRVMKWSSTPADRASRVRDNQRRHRAKVRSHVARLEGELEKSQMKLREAVAEIERLNAEIDRTSASATATSGDVYAKKATDARVSSLSPDPASLPSGATSKRVPHTNTIHQARDSKLPHDAGEERHEAPAEHYTQSSSGTTEDAMYRDVLRMGSAYAYETWNEDGCCALEAAGANESTTRCREAYSMVAEQNYAGLQASVIHDRLRPGFRGPVRAHDGCRVDNQLLFAVLDHISSSATGGYW